MTLMFEEKLYSILETIYYSSKMPILCLSRNGELLGSMGLDEDLMKIFTDYDVSKKIRSTNNIDTSNDIFTLEFDNNIKFSYIFLSDSKFIDNYFVLGPYKSNKTLLLIKDNLNLSTITYRPESCIKYIVELIKLTLDDHSNPVDNNNAPMHSIVKKAIKYIHKNYNGDITIDYLSNKLNINKCYFCTIFKQETGLTFSNFLNMFRIEKSKELLLHSDKPILDIALDVGFNNQNYYTMVFKKLVNKTPLEFRRSCK